MTDKRIEIHTVKSKIYSIRGTRVMLDRDLAELYQVETRILNQTVKRNIERFSDDFMFQLTENEFDNLKSQIVTSNWGGTRKLPFVFTEYGTLMLSSVLKSSLAIQINKMIVRAFVEIRQHTSTQIDYETLKHTIKQIESRMDTIEANHLVDHTIIGTKITQLSNDTKQIREDLVNFSKTLDDFQDAHIVIKRPEDSDLY